MKQYIGTQKALGNNDYWNAYMKVGSKTHWIYGIASEEDAAKAHDALILYFGTGAKLNNFEEGVVVPLSPEEAKQKYQRQIFCGVKKKTRNSGKNWRASYIDNTGKSRSLGVFFSEEDAARAYDVVARFYGAPLNFPGEVGSEYISLSLEDALAQHEEEFKFKPLLNRIEIDEETGIPYSVVTLTCGVEVKVDIEDSEFVSGAGWKFTNGYILGTKKYKGQQLHRLIMNPPDGVLVDHILHDTLDNRKCKLRLCTQKENVRNRRKLKVASSNYKGVTTNSNGRGYNASITIDGEKILLGVFSGSEEAALIYDSAARYHFEEFACTNFDGTDAESCDAIRDKYITKREVKHKQEYIGSSYREKEKAKNKYAASIHLKGKSVHITNCLTSEEAARIHDACAKYYFGDKAELNFPLDTTIEPLSIEEVRSSRNKPTASKYIGVGLDKKSGKWTSYIQVAGKLKNLGKYSTEEEAARVRDEKAILWHGEKAVLNFPIEK